MSIEFCPLQPAWGTWGEWASALVALAVGAAVYRLGSSANKIAMSAQDVANLSDAREARLLLIYISSDIESTLEKAREALAAITGPVHEEAYCADREYRQLFHRRATEMMMGAVEKRLGRLHVVDPVSGDAIGKAIGDANTLLTVAFFAGGQQHEDREAAYANLEKIRPILQDLGAQLEVAHAACQAALRSAPVSRLTQ